MKRPILLTLRYQLFPKGIGNTWIEINGIKNNPNSFLVVADYQHKKIINLPNNQIVTLSELPNVLIRDNRPRIIDHYALMILIDELCYYWENFLPDKNELAKLIATEMNKANITNDNLINNIAKIIAKRIGKEMS